MAKPNYSFEKRQRELQKRQKKEQKEKERADRKSGTGSGDGSEPSAATAENPEGVRTADAPAMGPGPT